jgi:alpha-L-arabinofuranosidase
MTVGRRTFLRSALAGSAALAAGRKFGLAQSSRATDARVDVLVNEAIGTINPNIYGHFVEHLGGVVYDGIWVGENSRVPNVGGIRSSIVDALKRIKAPVFRYPGGCFADSYDWRDGTGDRSKRPRRTNFWVDAPESRAQGNSPSRFDPNWFGTNEFLRFCQLVGGKAYLAANLRSLPAQDFYEWVEYCNSPAGSTTLAEQRASGSMGSREPYNVEFWGVGNESWGCGGNFTPEEYAQEYRRYVAAVPGYGVPLKFMAAGPNQGDLSWTRGFFEKMREKGEGSFDRIFAWCLHHYSWNQSGGRTNDWFEGKGPAVGFTQEQYYELLREADQVDGMIDRHWVVMGEYDRRHRTKIAVDEWGSWHKPGSEIAPSHILGQQQTLRDALVASISLDTFNRHADKVVMANVAQLVNCLHALFLADGNRFVLTPNYHVFEMFVPHMGAQSVRTAFAAPRTAYTRNGNPADIVGLAGSASLGGKQLTVTVTNTHASEPREAEVALHGARAASVQARVLTAPDAQAHNTFENPRAVEPKDAPATVGANGSLTFRFPPASVTRLQITLT